MVIVLPGISPTLVLPSSFIFQESVNNIKNTSDIKNIIYSCMAYLLVLGGARGKGVNVEATIMLSGKVSGSWNLNPCYVSSRGFLWAARLGRE